MEKVRIRIGGMSCAMCVKSLEMAFADAEGIEKADINLAGEMAELLFDSSKVSIEKIAEIVEETGFHFLGKSEDISIEQEADLLKTEINQRLSRAIWALAFSLPLMLLMWFPQFVPTQSWILPAVTILPFLWVSYSIFKKAFSSLRNKVLIMEVMYALGISTAYGASLAGSIGWLPSHHFMYYDTAFMLAGFMSLGKYLELKARAGTSSTLRNLKRLHPATAWVIDEGGEREIAVELLKPGFKVKVVAGQVFPADGTICNGEGYVDESMLTGEPVPVYKKVGDTVTGGTLNTDAAFMVEVQRCGKESMLSQIVEQVEKARFAKANIQQLADKAVVWFIPVVLTLSLITLLAWLFVGATAAEAIARAVSVLVIACPCALGLATPTALTAGLGRAAHFGILFRSGQAVEQAAAVNCVTFDKTGTLTLGKPEVSEVVSFQSDNQLLLSYAASIESQSAHPLAQAIVAAASQQNVIIKEAQNIVNHSGKGLSGTVEGEVILVGSLAFMRENGIAVSVLIQEKNNAFAEKGFSTVAVTCNGILLGLIALHDKLRAETKSVVAVLQQKYPLWLLSGDAQEAVTYMASEAGIENASGRLLPNEKAEILNTLAKQGYRTAFVGDGINDAPALASAHVGIAMGAGSDIARETGDIVLLRSNLQGVVIALDLAKKIVARIKLNLFWAFAYNLILIPLAAGLLHIPGLVFSPELAGFAMALSSVSVVSLSLLLNYWKPKNMMK